MTITFTWGMIRLQTRQWSSVISFRWSRTWRKSWSYLETRFYCGSFGPIYWFVDFV